MLLVSHAFEKSRGDAELTMAAVVNQECAQFPDPFAPPFLGMHNVTLSFVTNGSTPRIDS